MDGPDRVAAYFDRAAPFYDLVTGEAEAWPPNLVLAELLPAAFPAGTRALDLGAGTGRTVALLVNRGIKESDVVAVDSSAAMLDLLQACFPGVSTAVSTMERYPASAAFEVVACIGAMEFLRDAEHLARHLRNASLAAVTFEIANADEAAEPWGDSNGLSHYPRSETACTAIFEEAGLRVVNRRRFQAYRDGPRPVHYLLVVGERPGSAGRMAEPGLD